MKRAVSSKIALAAVTALGAGCASAPPRSAVEKHLPEIPETWAAAAHRGAAMVDEWWQEFSSPALTALIREALESNRDLRAAAARVDAAVAQARIAGADLQPRADFTFDASRRQQVFVGLPIPGAPEGVLSSRSTAFGASLNVSWELDLWGRIRAGTGAALADLQSSENEFHAVRNSLAAQTGKAWLALLEATRQLELAEATVESYRITSQQVRERYERGIRSPLDLRLALASESMAAALAAQRQAQREAAARQLEILVGRYPGGRLEQTNAMPILEWAVPAGLPSELLDRRPDLVAAERRLAAATSRVREAKAALFPRIALTASGGRTSSELEDLLSNNFNVWALAGNFAQPLFEGGRLRANVKLNEARLRERAEDYARIALQAFREVETALSDEGHLAERETQLAEAVRESNEALRLAEDRYRSGLEEFVTVLEAQRRAFENESQFLAVRRLRLENRIELHLALGGGYSENAPRLAGKEPDNL